MTDETENNTETAKDETLATKQPSRTRPVIRPRAKPRAEETPPKKQEPTLSAEPEVAAESETVDEKPETDSFSATREPKDDVAAADSNNSDRDWPAFGIRIAFMIIAGFLCALAFHVAGVLVVLQALVVLINDEPNETIKEWIAQLSTYVKDVFEYLSWQSDEKPYPLNGND